MSERLSFEQFEFSGHEVSTKNACKKSSLIIAFQTLKHIQTYICKKKKLNALEKVSKFL